jgi:hypothetical protein
MGVIESWNIFGTFLERKQMVLVHILEDTINILK